MGHDLKKASHCGLDMAFVLAQEVYDYLGQKANFTLAPVMGRIL
jgi:hypothetical protein